VPGSKRQPQFPTEGDVSLIQGTSSRNENQPHGHEVLTIREDKENKAPENGTMREKRGNVGDKSQDRLTKCEVLEKHEKWCSHCSTLIEKGESRYYKLRQSLLHLVFFERMDA
jgi:hypothetical protein